MKLKNHPSKRGVSLTEVVVAATLLVSMIGLVAPLTARFGRIWQTTRVHRLGVNELANQMDNLKRMDAASCNAALTELKCSAAIMHSMPEAKISGELIQATDGTRLKLKLELDGDKLAPLQLVGWLQTEPSVAEKTIVQSRRIDGDLP